MSIGRILIANRGEIACRIIRTCHRLGLDAVAVCSEAEVDALHARSADERVVVGPAKAQHSYLRADRIIDAARETAANAIHPGYGFLAENAEFARAVEESGIRWIGPQPEVIRRMGDKDRARQLAIAAGVPVVPGSRRFGEGELAGLDGEAERVGYPLLVKASAGGGGIGMQRVDAPEQLGRAVHRTQGLAKANFGDGTVFLERYIPHARHVEVQVLGLGEGRAVHLYERECSIQRRFQKIVEEAPSPVVDASLRSGLTAAALALVREQRYEGAGTVEFILDDETGAFYFLEMNTRLQVEHPVTEMITGEDIVEDQIRIADGTVDLARLTGAVGCSGHAIELRIYAEDPYHGFIPQPGKLEVFRVPVDADEVRLDSGVEEGSRVTPYYDPLLAKLIVRGDTRTDALGRAIEVLQRTRIEGIKTNLPFLLSILQHEDFAAGRTLTTFISDHEADLLTTAV